MAEQQGKLTFRHPVPEDQPAVLAVLDEWWGGQGGAAGAAERASLLPLLFFQHFTDTSFVAECDGRPVHPDYDGPGLDRVLFTRAI